MLAQRLLVACLLFAVPSSAAAQDGDTPESEAPAPLPEPPEAAEEPVVVESGSADAAAEAELESILDEGHEAVEALDADLPEPPAEVEPADPEAVNEEVAPEEDAVELVLARDSLRDGAVKWMVGVDFFAARAPADVWIFAYGLAVARHLGPELTVGVQQVSVGIGTLVQGRRWAFSLAPYAEYAPFLTGYFQAVVQGGLGLQARTGGRIRNIYGASPFVSGGGRIWIGSLASLATLVRAHYVATSGFLFPTKVIPRHGVALLIGMSFEVHL